MSNGSVIRFRTRTKSGGRGFSVDRLVIDEAMILSSASLAALMPLLTTAQNPQIWYLGSAADAEEHEHCGKWHSLRKRAMSDRPGSLCWLEWSAPDCPEGASPDERTAWREDRGNWAAANPALGYRLTERYIIDELDAFTDALDKWEIERLGVGRWPASPGDSEAVEPVIDAGTWRSLVERAPARTGHYVITIDADQDQTVAAIATTVKTAAGAHSQVVYDGPFNVDDIVSRVKALTVKDAPAVVVLDPKSSAGAFRTPLERAGVEVTAMTFAQVRDACRDFLIAVRESADGPRRFTHDDDPRLDEALAVAQVREFEAGRAWERKSGRIASLVAVSFGVWALEAFAPRLVKAAEIRSVSTGTAAAGSQWQSMNF